MKNPLVFLFWLLILGGVVNYFVSSTPVTEQDSKKMKEAYASYIKGENATTIGERQQSFNQALKLYTDLEKEYHPIRGDGLLYFDIANSYFQVGEYPEASLYYHRSLKLMPRNEKISHNINLINEKLGVNEKSDVTFFDRIFAINKILSLPEQFQIFLLLASICVLLITSYIWHNKRWMKNGTILTGFFALMILIGTGYYTYLAPTEALIVRSTGLYREAGLQYAKVLDEPILSGNKVVVLAVLNEGKWLKIMTPTGNLGFVPIESIRII